MPVDQKSLDRRGSEILKVFDEAFGALMKQDPDAIRTKFRKMAGGAFAFYRGSADLFYHDMEKDQYGAQYLDEQTGHVWVHGDLHAENFGTYMDSDGDLVFNVNDFDEAYVGPFIWDLKRFSASMALVGYGKALSDKQIGDAVRCYARAYQERIHLLATEQASEDVPGFTLRNTKGPLLGLLRLARLQNQPELLDGMTEIRDADRRFTRGGGAVELDKKMRDKVLAAYESYLKTLPDTNTSSPKARNVKDVVGRRGIGIGSAGLPSYNILLEGESDALENDKVIYMKQSVTAAVAKHVKSGVAAKYFNNQGQRTVISQRSLQASAPEWLGWTEIDGNGFMVAEVSPFEVDIEWSDINDPKGIVDLCASLGQATAMMHGAGDDNERHTELVSFSPEKAIDAAIKDAKNFPDVMVDFAHEYSAKVRHDHEIFVHLFRNGQIPGL